jgi:hypothetical protein
VRRTSRGRLVLRWRYMLLWTCSRLGSRPRRSESTPSVNFQTPPTDDVFSYTCTSWPADRSSFAVTRPAAPAPMTACGESVGLAFVTTAARPAAASLRPYHALAHRRRPHDHEAAQGGPGAQAACDVVPYAHVPALGGVRMARWLRAGSIKLLNSVTKHTQVSFYGNAFNPLCRVGVSGPGENVARVAACSARVASAAASRPGRLTYVLLRNSNCCSCALVESWLRNSHRKPSFVINVTLCHPLRDFQQC